MNLSALTYLGPVEHEGGRRGAGLLQGLQGPDGLGLNYTNVSDAGLVHFKNCKNLTRLGLEHTTVSDAGLANFKECKNLTLLWLADTQVGDAGMAHFQDCKALTDLNLAGTKVSDVGLAHFKDCKNLKHLYLDRTQVGDAGLANFKGMPLMALNIDDTAITDLTPLQGMPLEDIRLTPKNITQGLDILRDMKSLKTIGIELEPSLAGGGVLGALRQGGVQAGGGEAEMATVSRRAAGYSPGGWPDGGWHANGLGLHGREAGIRHSYDRTIHARAVFSGPRYRLYGRSVRPGAVCFRISVAGHRHKSR